MITLTCPGCALPMRAVAARPKGSDHQHQLDRCERCGGVWLDRSELETACPTVSGLRQRAFEVRCLGQRGGNLTSCPRCAATPYEFRLVDLMIDYCLGCGGVWLDALEQQDMLRGVGADAANDRAVGERGPYRAVTRLREKDRTVCAGCAIACNTGTSYVSAAGLICRDCYIERMNRAAKTRVAEGGPSAFEEAIELSVMAADWFEPLGRLLSFFVDGKAMIRVSDD